LSRGRLQLDAASRVPHLWARRLLRRLTACARVAAFQCDRTSDDRVARARRHVGLVLRASTLLRSDARCAAQAALAAAQVAEPADPPLVAVAQSEHGSEKHRAGI